MEVRPNKTDKDGSGKKKAIQAEHKFLLDVTFV